MVITTAHLHSTKPELRFKSCSRRVGDSRWWRSLTMVPAGNNAIRLSAVNLATKTILHYHHHQRTIFPKNLFLQNISLVLVLDHLKQALRNAVSFLHDSKSRNFLPILFSILEQVLVQKVLHKFLFNCWAFIFSRRSFRLAKINFIRTACIQTP